MNLLKKFLRVSGFAAAVALIGGAGLAYADVNVSGGNDTTGASSENLTRIFTDRSWLVDFENNLRLDNRLFARLNTGENETGRNTTVGADPSTGSIYVSADLMNPSTDTGSIFDFGLGLGNDNIDVTGVNEVTGANSRNINEVRANKTFRLDVENNARINNTVDLALNTGNNEVERNTSVGDVMTGNIDASVSVDNAMASNPVAMLSGMDLANESDITADFSNGTTGFNSVNRNFIEANSRVNINLENNAQIDNSICVEANTGNNEINENTTVGEISTGDISVDLSIAN